MPLSDGDLEQAPDNQVWPYTGSSLPLFFCLSFFLFSPFFSSCSVDILEEAGFLVTKSTVTITEEEMACHPSFHLNGEFHGSSTHRTPPTSAQN